MPNQIDVKYLNKDFTSFKSDLIEYAKSYYPTAYNDFSQPSPGSMFIEMASYVGDVLSFYLDNQLQETFLQYAKQKNNLYTLAYMMGYRPKVTSAAITDLDVYMQIPAVTVSGSQIPDWSYALTVASGMQVKSNIDNSVVFYCPNKIDFNTSSSLDPTNVSVYTINGINVPQSYLIQKKAQAISGQVKNQSFSFGTGQRFATINLQDSNIINILSITDSNGYTWYEVPYLAQDYILNPVQNTANNYPTLYQQSNQVPYMIQKLQVPRRFVTRFKSDNSLQIEFGSGINSQADSAIIPNPNNVSIGNSNGLTLLNTAYDPTNFVTTQTYGLAPQNVTLTVQYLVGGGAASNAMSNQLTIPIATSVSNLANKLTYQNTIATNNANPAVGGGDGDTVEQLRLNIAAEYPSQLRAVTQEDYLARTLSMPSKFGKVSKAYVTKDDATFQNYMASDIAERDSMLISMYILGLDSNNNLAVPSAALMQNVQNWLSEYRMLTDAVNIKSAYIINIGCNFDVIIRPNFNGQDVIARCLLTLQNYFNIDNWQVNQPIILSEVYSLLDQVSGVQTVKKVEIVNKSGVNNGYSQYGYDISAGTLNNVIYPSLDPSVFEVKYPTSDIQGRVVSF